MLNKQKLLYDLFQSYYDARKNKRNTLNQLDFEFNLEENLIKLYDELLNWNYKVWKSIYFIQNHPVKREIFAWDFRDRVVHHLLYNYISPIFEKEFIYDSYSCRKWKWTSFWVKRVQKFIRSCSNNYTEDCYILKLDISGYFMNINKDILFEKIEKVLNKNTKIQTHPWIPSLEKGRRLQVSQNKNFSLFQREYPQGEGLEKTIIKNLSPLGGKYPKGDRGILNIIKKIIYNDPTKNCIIKWKKSDWVWLPKSKSLFFAKNNCWLPIWNLTSQVFSNIYLSDFDKFVKYDLSKQVPLTKGVVWKTEGLYYGRYVDDFIIVHKNKEFLKSIIPKIQDYLQINLWLTLHPKKIYLQHYTHGVPYLWSFIKPYRIYTWKRTKWNFYQKIQILNQNIREICHYRTWYDNLENNNQLTRSPCQARGWQKEKARGWQVWIDNNLKDEFRATINSYLWFLKHHKSYKLRQKLLLDIVSPYFWNYFYISKWYCKVVMKRKAF